MPCFVPFKNNLDLSFLVLRSVAILDDELVQSMKCFSIQAEDLGCVHSSVLKSIHGNLFVWYGAWIKRSEEARRLLNATLVSSMEEISHLAVLIQYGFYEVYGGESKDGSLRARFSSGDTILLCGMMPASEEGSELPCACMAILRSSFNDVEASAAAVCLLCRDRPLVTILHVWKSLQACYSWLITADYRRTIRPYIRSFTNEAQFDLFRVIYVSSDDVVNCHQSAIAPQKF